MTGQDVSESSNLLVGDHHSSYQKTVGDIDVQPEQLDGANRSRSSSLVALIGIMVFAGCMLLSYDFGASTSSQGHLHAGETVQTPILQGAIRTDDDAPEWCMVIFQYIRDDDDLNYCKNDWDDQQVCKTNIGWICCQQGECCPENGDPCY